MAQSEQILIAGDSKWLRDVASALREGHSNVVHTVDGAELEAALDRDPAPGLLLLGDGLTGLDPFDALFVVQQHPPFKRPRVVLVTGIERNQPLLTFLRESGVDAFISPHSAVADGFTIVEDTLHKQRRREQRFSFQRPVKLLLPGNDQVEGTTQDLSRHGIGIRVAAAARDRLVEEGERMRVEVSRETRFVEAFGTMGGALLGGGFGIGGLAMGRDMGSANVETSILLNVRLLRVIERAAFLRTVVLLGCEIESVEEGYEESFEELLETAKNEEQ